MIPIELLGWLSTIVILSSFVFDGVKMRVLNSIGCIGWLVWGYYNGEVSIMVLNIIIVLIHLFKIIRIQRKLALEMEKKMEYLRGI